MQVQQRSLYKGVVYGLDEGILAAMDAQTGQKKWKGGRYGFGQLLLAGDTWWCCPKQARWCW